MVTKLSHMKTSPPLSVTQELFWPKYCHISRMSFPFLSFLKTSVCWTLTASGDDSPVIMIDLWSHCCGLNFSQSRRNIPCQFSQKVFPKVRFSAGQAACGKIIQESYHITTQLGYYILHISAVKKSLFLNLGIIVLEGCGPTFTFRKSVILGYYELLIWNN